MKFVFFFVLSMTLFACSKVDDAGQQDSKSRFPRKASYYQPGASNPSEVLTFNYDSLPNTVLVSGGVGAYLQPEALYQYNTDSFLTGYQSYNEGLFEQIARSIVIKRDQGNKVLSMITTRISDVYDLYNMPGKQLFNYNYTLSLNGRLDGYQCDLTVDGTISPQEKVVFVY